MKTHEERHEAAREIARLSETGEEVPKAVYDAFMGKVSTFNRQGRRFEKDFTAAHSYLDALTGLQNRKSMMNELFRERARAVRNKAPFSVATADLDRFKQANDTYGHRAGDQILVNSTQVFLSHLRPFDGIFRYGGEDFLFLLPHADVERARTIPNRLRRELASTSTELADGTLVWLTVSVGIASMEGPTSVEELIDRADKAFYVAKRRGRNQVVTWPIDEPATRAAARR